MDDRLDALPCGWLSFVDDGTIVRANRTLARLLGRPRSAIEGERFESLLTVATRIFHQTHVFPLLRLQGHVEELELELRGGDGRPIPVLFNAARVERDGTVHNECTLVPMRTRHRYEEAVRIRQREAEAATHASTLQLHSMSHELRTPLNAIIGFTRQVLKGERANVSPRALLYLERVEANGVHLLAVINAVLDLSKIRAGKAEIILAPTDVGRVVRDSVDQLEGAPRPAGVALEAIVPDHLVPTESDATRLRQVLTNLVGNALKFTAQGQVRVRVTADDTGAPLMIEVEDTGPGIPADRLDAIFEPFEQAEKSTERRYGGTGLGLPIARGLCHMMGCELTVTSVVGAGTVFRITLPPPLLAVTLAAAVGASVDR